MSANVVRKPEQIRLITECRQSGFSDYQWCREQEINPGTFYDWVSKLRKAGYTIPDSEKKMLRYLSDNETMLSDEGIKTLNAYALRGYQLIHDFSLEQKPTSTEELLEAFNMTIQFYKQQ